MNSKILQPAIDLLKAGGVVICPTESVYGLVADPFQPSAIQKIFDIKKRATTHALSIHVAEPRDIHQWATNISPFAQRLIEQYFPGPLTLVVKKKSSVSPIITGGKDSIGIRCPNHPIAHALIKGMGHGVIMTSANISGQPSPVTAQEARAQLGDVVSLIIDDGPCQLGISSTVIDVTGDEPKILRQGLINIF